MHIEDSKARHIQQRFPQNIAARKHDQVRRPLSETRNRIRRVLILANRYWETIKRRHLPQTAKRSTSMFEETVKMGIVHSVLSIAVTWNQFLLRVARHISDAPLRELAQQSCGLQSGKEKRPNWNVSALSQAHRHGASSF